LAKTDAAFTFSTNIFKTFGRNLVTLNSVQVYLKDACWSESNMATAAILKLEKPMLFSHFQSIFTKLGKIVATLNNNTYMLSKTPGGQNSTWRLPPS